MSHLLPVIENALGIAILVLIAAFVLNRLGVLVYMVGCVVHTARRRDVVNKDPSGFRDDLPKRLNAWMVRTWWAIVVAIVAYCTVRALK